MPEALYFTDDPAACELLAADPFALLVLSGVSMVVFVIVVVILGIAFLAYFLS